MIKKMNERKNMERTKSARERENAIFGNKLKKKTIKNK